MAFMLVSTKVCLCQVGSSCQAGTVMGMGAEDPQGSNASPTTTTTSTFATHPSHKLQDMEDDRHQHQPQRPLLEQQLQRGTPEPIRSGMTTLQYVLTSSPAVSVATSQPVISIPASGNGFVSVCLSACLLFPL